MIAKKIMKLYSKIVIISDKLFIYLNVIKILILFLLRISIVCKIQ